MSIFRKKNTEVDAADQAAKLAAFEQYCSEMEAKTIRELAEIDINSPDEMLYRDQIIDARFWMHWYPELAELTHKDAKRVIEIRVAELKAADDRRISELYLKIYAKKEGK